MVQWPVLKQSILRNAAAHRSFSLRFLVTSVLATMATAQVFVSFVGGVRTCLRHRPRRFHKVAGSLAKETRLGQKGTFQVDKVQGSHQKGVRTSLHHRPHRFNNVADSLAKEARLGQKGAFQVDNYQGSHQKGQPPLVNVEAPMLIPANISQAEKRIAKDGIACPLTKFIEHYGENEGTVQWDQAAEQKEVEDQTGLLCNLLRSTDFGDHNLTLGNPA